MKMIDIWINCPTIDVANRIADHLMENRLASACNRFPEVSSRYYWDGEVKEAREYPLRIKSQFSLFERIKEEVRELHPYKTPSIIGLNVECVNEDYLNWIVSETDGSEGTDH